MADTTTVPAPGHLDEQTAQLLERLAGEPHHREARAEIVGAIIADGRAHAGVVDPNRVRNALANSETPYPPQLVGAVYGALRSAGVLEWAGWTTSTDTAGGNSGKPARTYTLAEGWRR